MKRNDSFVIKNVGGKHLLVPLGAQVKSMNGLIILNESGGFIWDLLSEDRTMDDLSIAVSARFQRDLIVARADVQTFIADINLMGLVEE